MASLGACLLVTAARADNVAAARDARALARARTELLATIHRLPLAPGLSVAGWAAQEAELDRDLRRWVRAREPYGGERVYSDGACDIDVRVTPELLVWRIREWQTRDASRLHDVLTDEQLETARDSWPILWGGGIAAGSEQPGAECPPGWEDVSQAGIAATREAATVQALGQLLDEIGAVRLAGAWEVRAFYTSDEVLAQAFIDAVRERSATEVSFAGDQVAVARLGLSRATLVRLLTELHDLYYLEGQFSRADIRELVLQPGVSEFVAGPAAGFPAPPDRRRGGRVAGRDRSRRFNCHGGVAAAAVRIVSAANSHRVCTLCGARCSAGAADDVVAYRGGDCRPAMRSG